MAGRDRDTYIHRRGVTPETMSVISSKNRIYAIPADTNAANQFFQVGVVATFDPSETRAIETVRGIGYGDHVAELVPGVTDPMTLSLSRTAQYLSMIYQAFGYKGGVDGLVRSLRHHKWPFDIVNETIMSQLIGTEEHAEGISVEGYNDEKYQAILTYYEGCWMSDFSSSYASDAALVQENVTVNVTDIVADLTKDYGENSVDLFNSSAKSRIIGNAYTFNTADAAGISVPAQTAPAQTA